MFSRDRRPNIYFDPVFEDMGFQGDRTLGGLAILFAGFYEGEIRSLHLVDNPITYRDEHRELFGKKPGQHAIIDIGTHVDRFQQSMIDMDTAQSDINTEIYRQLVSLAKETPRKRTLGSYITLNLCSAYISGTTTFLSEGVVSSCGVPPGALNYGIVASVGIMTAVKLSNIPDTFDRDESQLLKQARAAGTRSFPVISMQE
jgi:hypothetical protein